jgi:WD40 repeat protein
VKVKFIDENLYGCMYRNNIKLWDVREKCVKGIMGFSSYELEDFDWLTGWTAPQVATLSEDNQVKVYDYRMA